MYFDALTSAAIAAELRAELINGRVQQVLFPDRLSVAFEIYANRQRHYLLASAHPQTARVHLLADKPRRGIESAPPLLQLLRKYVRGAHLVEVHHPPTERILHLAFAGPEEPVTLVIEIIGRYSNLVVVNQDGTVLSAIKHVGPDKNRYRVVLPNQPYVPPPPQDKLLPEEVTEYRLRQLLAEWTPNKSIRSALVGGIAGISPLAAREIVFRAMGDEEAPVEAVERITPLLEACQALTLEPPQPCLVHDEDGEVIAFAPYRLTHMGTPEATHSMSQAVAAYFDTGSDGYQGAKAPLLEVVKETQARLARRREKLAEEAAAAGDPESLKQQGEAILAYAFQIQPGQAELTVEWVIGESPLKVQLDPSLSPSENAQAYFRRYRKAQRAAMEIPTQVARVEAEQDYLEQLAQDLVMADNRPEIDAVAVALAEAGYFKKKKKRRPSSPAARPLRFTSPDGFRVWVGKNASQNENLTFRRAAPEDIWLHARGLPGAHVIIQTEGRAAPEETVAWAAGLTAYFSRGRDDTQIAVDVVQRRHVRKLKGGQPGQVTYRHERTLRVAPKAPSEPLPEDD